MRFRPDVLQRWLGAGALVGLLSCSSAKPEVAALAAGVERFHRASNDERPARADALAQVACEDKEVCAAKALCVEAASATATALRLKDEVKAVLADVERGKTSQADPAVKDLPAKLDRATELLESGRTAMPACDHKVARPSGALRALTIVVHEAPLARKPCSTHWPRAFGRRRIVSPV